MPYFRRVEIAPNIMAIIVILSPILIDRKPNLKLEPRFQPRFRPGKVNLNLDLKLKSRDSQTSTSTST